MSNLTLAPEEDDPNFPRGRNFKPSPRDNSVGSASPTEAQKLLVCFNPLKVGFGILPWPGTDQPPQVSDTVALAMKYLLEGKDREENK